MKKKTTGIVIPGVLIAPSETPILSEETKNKVRALEDERIRKYKAARFN